MTNAPHLLAEDRPEFEHVLDEALRDASLLAALRAPGAHLTAEQLRTKALLAMDAIAAEADLEYRHYTVLRAGLEHPDQPSADAGGPGLYPTLTVLAPILSWSAAGLLLAIGYGLRAAEPELALGRAVVTAGWLAIAIGIAALAVGAVGLLLTARRDGAATPSGADRQRYDDLTEARADWLAALRTRAVLPYLHANLDAAPALSPQPASPPSPPDLLRPGYSRGSFGSPGFSSPGVEGLTDPEGRESRTAEFSSPGYSPPGFTSPDDV